MLLVGCADNLAERETEIARTAPPQKFVQIIDAFDQLCVQHNSIDEIIEAAESVDYTDKYMEELVQELNETENMEGDYKFRAAYDLRIGSEEYSLLVSDFTDRKRGYTIQCSLQGENLTIEDLVNAISQKYLSSEPSWKSFFCALSDRNVEAAKRYCDYLPRTYSSDKSILLAVDEDLRLFAFRFDEDDVDTQMVWDYTGKPAGQWIKEHIGN
jgi:hypothetical protein